MNMLGLSSLWATKQPDQLYLVPEKSLDNQNHLTKLSDINRHALTQALALAAAPTDNTHRATATKTTVLSALATGAVVVLREGYRRSFLENRILETPATFCASYIANNQLNNLSSVVEKLSVLFGYGEFPKDPNTILGWQVGDHTARALICNTVNTHWVKRAVVLERTMEVVSELPQAGSDAIKNAGKVVSGLVLDSKTVPFTMKKINDAYKYVTTPPNTYDIQRWAMTLIKEPSTSLYVIVPVAVITTVGLSCLYNYKFKAEKENQKKNVENEIDVYIEELGQIKSDLFEESLEIDILDDKAFATLHKKAKGILENMAKIKSDYNSVNSLATSGQNDEVDAYLTQVERICKKIVAKEPLVFPAVEESRPVPLTFMQEVSNKINDTATAAFDGIGKRFEVSPWGIVKCAAGAYAASMVWDDIFK